MKNTNNKTYRNDYPKHEIVKDLKPTQLTEIN